MAGSTGSVSCWVRDRRSGGRSELGRSSANRRRDSPCSRLSRFRFFTSQIERNKRLEGNRRSAHDPLVDEDSRNEKGQDMGTVLIVLLVLFLLGGGGYWYRSRRA